LKNLAGAAERYGAFPEKEIQKLYRKKICCSSGDQRNQNHICYKYAASQRLNFLKIKINKGGVPNEPHLEDVLMSSG